MLSKIKIIAKDRVVWDKDSTQRSVAGDFYDTTCDALEDALEIIAKLERVARAAKALDEYVELPEITEWMSRYRWCPHCGYKQTDGHWEDCDALALIEALEDAKHLLEKN